MALTTDELAYIRESSGDTDTASPDVSDAKIQWIYGNSAQGDGDLDKTVYYVIRRRLAKYATDVESATTPQTGTSYSASKYSQLRNLLDIWAGITGLPGSGGLNTGSLSTGVISLGLDTTEDDV